MIEETMNRGARLQFDLVTRLKTQQGITLVGLPANPRMLR
jgi:hypothetical protein